MANLKDEIKAFRDKQSGTYLNDPIRITRDYTTVQRSVKDHKDRWLFELIQNCDDEESTVVDIRITEKAIYIADNGNGFNPEAAESISGTDYSDKPAGMIGRKGVGFKSVYQITDNPKVFTGDDEGLEFNRYRAQKWFTDEDIEYEENQLPYQWLPFFLSRKKAEENDTTLRDLKNMSTVVVLPFKSNEERLEAIKKIEEWPSHTLFPFNHIQKLCFHSEEISYEVTVTRKDHIWKLNDTRNDTVTKWKVLKECRSTPRNILKTLEPEDQKYVEEVSFLIAAPFDNNIVRPTKNDIPLHVFYPTEEPAPVRLLLHGEFLVKGDRTKLIPLKSSDFNEWVADTLAETILEFVNNSYYSESPSEYLKLLHPIGETKNETTISLWDNILTQAREKLRLPNTKGNQELNISQCRILSVSIRSDKAREILSLTPNSQKLIHRNIDEDKEAQKTLSELGCEKITDLELIDIIKNNISENENNDEWIWNCWEWLGSWLADKPTYSDDYEKRLEQIKSISLLPISGNLFSCSELKGNEITWTSKEESIPQIPDWLPLKFIDKWFQRRVSELHQRDPIIRLLKKLDIQAFKKKSTIVDALKNAIKEYWSNPDSNPERFIEFLLTDEMKELDGMYKLSECPIPVRIKGEQKEKWVKANKAYLGHEWGHELIEVVFKDVNDIVWALPRKDKAFDDQHDLYQSLGCVSYPRINEKNIKNKRLIDLPEECKEWISSGIDRENGTDNIDAIKKFEKLNVSELSLDSATALIRLLAKNWDYYYWDLSITMYRWIPRSKEHRKSVDSYWKFQVENELIPPILDNWANAKPLTKCWIPNKQTHRSVGQFLPIIDLDKFQEDKEAVEEWLTDEIHVRRDQMKISQDEWHEIIAEKIPKLSNGEDLINQSNLRDAISRCYEASLESLDLQSKRRYNDFFEVPLLSRKESRWDLIPANEVYLADDPEFSEVFSSECWQIDFSQRNKKRAKSIFGLQIMSEKVEQTLKPGLEIPEKTKRITDEVSTILPFVYATRRSDTQIEPDKLESTLKSFEFIAIDVLKASLELDNVANKEIHRDYGIDDFTVFINKSKSNQLKSTIALALADAIGVKSEADFYENLLRCKTDDDRLEKLSTKGLTKEVVERYIRDFKNETNFPVYHHSMTERNKKNIEGNETQQNKSKSTSNYKKKSTSRSQNSTSSHMENNESKSTKSGESQLSLKDPNTEPIDFISNQTEQSSQSSTESKGKGNTSGSDQLSQSKKLEIEKSGRVAAERVLKEKGYHTEQMPDKNPGFDIKAVKDNKELRIEIKAHRGKSSNIEITQRQIVEYSLLQEKENVFWELWNVEQLSENSSEPIKITRYSSLPEETWNTRVVTINLNQCQPIQNDL